MLNFELLLWAALTAVTVTGWALWLIEKKLHRYTKEGLQQLTSVVEDASVVIKDVQEYVESQRLNKPPSPDTTPP